MATPIDHIGHHELSPTLDILTKVGWTTDDFGLLRKGKDEANARRTLEFLRGLKEGIPTTQHLIPSDYRGPHWDERAEGPYQVYPEDWPEASGTPAVLDCDPDFFKGLDFSHTEALIKRYRTGPDGSIVLPEHMSALAVIPKIDSVVKLVRKPKKSWNHVNIAMQYLLGVLNEAYGKGFYDWTEGKIGPDYHRLAEATAKALAMDADRTPGDVHVLPVQTGALFAGYSVRAARGHLSAMPHHYGMHCFGGGVIMLPHHGRPERFVEGALFMDCPGTERSLSADGAYDNAPYWSWDGGERGLGSDWVYYPNRIAGSGSLLVLPAFAKATEGKPE